MEITFKTASIGTVEDELSFNMGTKVWERFVDGKLVTYGFINMPTFTEYEVLTVFVDGSNEAIISLQPTTSLYLAYKLAIGGM